MREGLNKPAITLRPAEPRDLDALTRLRGDQATQALLLGHPEARTCDDTADWIERRSKDATGAFWVIDDGAGACAGFVQLTGRHGIDRHAHFGIALLPETRGRGIGQAAMAALTEHARGIGLRKLMCEVRADNGSAIALYLAMGFRQVGTLSKHYDDGQGLWDVVVMERLLEPAA